MTPVYNDTKFYFVTLSRNSTLRQRPLQRDHLLLQKRLDKEIRFAMFSAAYHSEAHKKVEDTHMEPTELHCDSVVKKKTVALKCQVF